MRTKQEQIEEMANCNPCYERYGECPIKDKVTCTSWTRAVNQYEQGYRKIPEGSVVLTKEECEHKVILDEDHFERALNYEREKARKETAKEIERLKAEIERLERVINDQNELCWGCNKSVKGFAEKLKNYIRQNEVQTTFFGNKCFIDEDIIDELLKQYGVEVEE